MTEKKTTTVDLEFETGVDVHTGGSPGKTVLMPSGWVSVEYSDGVLMWYPPQAFKFIRRTPVAVAE